MSDRTCNPIKSGLAHFLTGGILIIPFFCIDEIVNTRRSSLRLNAFISRAKRIFPGRSRVCCVPHRAALGEDQPDKIRLVDAGAIARCNRERIEPRDLKCAQ